MQETILKQDLLEDIKNEANGFRFGEIWKLSNKALGALIPILRHKDFKRSYIMIEELDKKDYQVVDSGNISQIKLKVKKALNKPIFIRTGNMFEGKGTQSRANEFSIVITPEEQEEEIIIPARCVHASHPISEGAGFERYGYAPREVLNSLFSGSGQSRVWASVSRSSARLYKMTGTSSRAEEPITGGFSDSMIGNIKEIKKSKSKISDIIKKVPCLENQVGIVIFDENGVSNIEVFDHPGSWKAFHESIIESYSDILSKEQKEQLFELKKENVPKKIKEFIESMYDAKENKAFDNKSASTYIFRNNSIIGEYTILNDGIIHLLSTRKENEDIEGTGQRPGDFRIISMPALSTDRAYERRPPIVTFSSA